MLHTPRDSVRHTSVHHIPRSATYSGPQCAIMRQEVRRHTAHHARCRMVWTPSATLVSIMNTIRHTSVHHDSPPHSLRRTSTGGERPTDWHASSVMISHHHQTHQ
eukprot:2071271-Rhodomonas_salina.3